MAVAKQTWCMVLSIDKAGCGFWGIVEEERRHGIHGVYVYVCVWVLEHRAHTYPLCVMINRNADSRSHVLSLQKKIHRRYGTVYSTVGC